MCQITPHEIILLRSHVAGKELCNAHTLSRAPVCNPDSQSEQLQKHVTAYVNLVIDHLPATGKD